MAVFNKDGKGLTIGVYMRRMSQDLNLVEKHKGIEQVDHMKIMSDMYQELGIRAVEEYYQEKGKVLMSIDKL